MKATLIRQLSRYGITGLGSVGLYIGLLWMLLHVAPLPEPVANAAAYAVATLLNYLLNFYWSFGSQQSHAKATAKFLTIVTVGAVLNSAFVAFVSGQMEVPVLWAAVVFALAWPLVSFSAQKLWAFRA